MRHGLKEKVVALLACTPLALSLGCSEGSGKDRPLVQPPETTESAAPQPQVVPETVARNSAPIIESLEFEPPRPRPGESVHAVVSVRDRDGDLLRVGYEWYLNGNDVRAKAERVSFPRARKGDVIEVLVTANDSRGARSRQRAQTRVGNSPPLLSFVRVEPKGPVQRGVELVAKVEVQDPDRDAVRVRFEWQVNGRTRPDHGDRLQTEPLRRGDRVQVFAVASDGEDESERIAAEPVEIGNTPPEIVSQPAAAREDGSFFYQVRARDPDNDRGLLFSLDEAPDGMTISRTDGEVAWQPREDQLGEYRVAIVVDDRHGGKTSQLFTISIAGESSDGGPAATR